jgi:hypothetical protein
MENNDECYVTFQRVFGFLLKVCGVSLSTSSGLGVAWSTLEIINKKLGVIPGSFRVCAIFTDACLIVLELMELPVSSIFVLPFMEEYRLWSVKQSLGWCSVIMIAKLQDNIALL